MASESQLQKEHAERLGNIRSEQIYAQLQQEIGSISVTEPQTVTGTILPLTEAIVSVINKKES